MRQLDHQVLEGTTLVLEGPEVSFLGPDLALRRCTVVLNLNARSLTVSRTSLFQCTVAARKKLTNFRWCNATIDDCTFEGLYSGCDFGHWPEFYEPQGGIARCDFSMALLDGCRFLNTDMGGMKMPAWPCFTVLSPRRNAEELANRGPVFEILHRTYLEFPVETAAVTHHVPSLVKRLGGSTDEILATVSKLDCVIPIEHRI